MGAQSVTGVGLGSAEGSIKGPGNGRNIFTPVANPHIVAAGRVTLSTGAATVTFPTSLTGSNVNYSVCVTDNSSSAHAVSINGRTNDSSGNFQSFTLAGNGSDVCDWMVCTVGYGF